MNEREFKEKMGTSLNEWTYKNANGIGFIGIPIYYSLDDENAVCVDFESIKEEFKEKLRQIEKLTK